MKKELKYRFVNDLPKVELKKVISFTYKLAETGDKIRAMKDCYCSKIVDVPWLKVVNGKAKFNKENI